MILPRRSDVGSCCEGAEVVLAPFLLLSPVRGVINCYVNEVMRRLAVGVIAGEEM